MGESARVAPDPMWQQAFETNIEELLIAIEGSLKSQLILPGLLLLYAGIDIMAWLNRPESHKEVERSDFVGWADKYVLPGTELACSAIDLYAARCSLLHSYTAESGLSRRGDAKEIFYARGNGRAGDLQRVIDHGGTRSAVVVHVEHLFHAFRAGVGRFKESLSNDPEKGYLVYERASKFFSHVPTWIVNAASPKRAVGG